MVKLVFRTGLAEVGDILLIFGIPFKVYVKLLAEVPILDCILPSETYTFTTVSMLSKLLIGGRIN